MDLTAAERLVQTAFGSGAEVTLRRDPVRAEAIREIVQGEGGSGRRPALRLAGADVTGALDLSSVDIGAILEFVDCTFTGPVDLSHSSVRSLHWIGCRLQEGLVLTGAQVAIRVELTGSVLRGAEQEDTGGFADYALAVLDGERVTIGQDLAAEGLVAHGTLVLGGCRIGRHLDLEGAELLAPDVAITLENAVVGGDLQAMRVQMSGEAVFSGLTVNGWADWRSVRGQRIDAERLAVGLGINATELTMAGTLDLTRCRVGGDLLLVDARLQPPAGALALDGTGAAVDGDVFAEGMESSGVVSLAGSEVKGQVYFGLTQMAGLDCRRLVADGLELSGDPVPTDLSRTRVGELVLHAPGPARLAGLTYETLVSDELQQIKVAIRWLAGDPDGFSAQPYEQLAAFYTRSGRGYLARRIMLESRRIRRRMRPWHRRIFGYGIDLAAGYGYALSRAFVWMLVFWVVAAVWYTFDPYFSGARPVLYGLDLVLPASPFGVEEKVTLTDTTSLTVSFVVQAAGYLLTIPVLSSITRAFSHT